MASLNKAKVFRALGDETRLAMVRLLRDAGGRMPCARVVEGCGISRSASTYHYKELEQAGLITRQREGQLVTIILHTDLVTAEFPGLLDAL